MSDGSRLGPNPTELPNHCPLRNTSESDSLPVGKVPRNVVMSALTERRSERTSRALAKVCRFADVSRSLSKYLRARPNARAAITAARMSAPTL